MEALLLASEAIHFASAMLLVGGLAFRLYAGMPAWRIRSASVAALASALLWLVLEAGEMGGSWADSISPATLGTVLGDTDFGEVWTGRMLIAIITCLVAFLPRSKARDGALCLLAVLLLGSLALIGHAVMRTGVMAVLQVTNQGLHLLAGGGWLGGLPPLAVALRTIQSTEDRVVLLHRFSIAGLIAVPVILLTGIVNSVLQLGSFAGFATPYGQVLIIKICLVGLMILLATVNRVILLPRSAMTVGAGVALAAIRRTALVEAALGALVLAIASLLGSLPPPFVP